MFTNNTIYGFQAVIKDYLFLRESESVPDAAEHMEEAGSTFLGVR